MMYTLHKFHHYLIGNKFIFYVDHIVLTYLVNKPQLFDKITRWLLQLFLKYDFTVIYKPGQTHYMGNPRLPHTTKSLGYLTRW
jgi:hypothetical protein